MRAEMLRLTPLVEPLSIDEAFLDLGGTKELNGACPSQLLAALALRVEGEPGITVSIGLSGTSSSPSSPPISTSRAALPSSAATRLRNSWRPNR